MTDLYCIRLLAKFRISIGSAGLCMRRCSLLASSSEPTQSTQIRPIAHNDDNLTALRLAANSLRSIQSTLLRTKEAVLFADKCHRIGNKEALRAIVEYIEDDTSVSKAHPHRVLYYSIHLAISLDELNVAKKLLELVPTVVHVLATSLRVQLLSRLGCLDEALMQLELVLNEDVPRFDVKSKLADEALDELCAAIKAKPDSVLEMRRFRYLQRLLTKYQRRTKCTVEELLRATLFSAPKQRFEHGNKKLDEGTLEKVVKVAPYILSDS
uniref:Uncharacterized protein n=1 Tax=Parascaris univalens TaxID=6257 RepID=A0A914ZZX3_PARUN